MLRISEPEEFTEESTEEPTEESLEVESTEETSLEVESLEVESTEESTLDVKPTESLKIESTEEMSLEVEGTENEPTTPPAIMEKPTEVGNKVKKNRVTNGKEGNIILRVSAGTGKLPVGGEFYGQVFKNKSLENEEIYMWQTTTHQWSTPVGELYAGFGN